MPLHSDKIAGFDLGERHGRHRTPVGLSVQFDDGTSEDAPQDVLDYLLQSLSVARRAGVVVPVGGDGRTVSANEAAELLGVSRPTIYAWVKKGKLDEQRDTHDHRIYTASIDRVLLERDVHTAMTRLDGTTASKVAVLSGLSDAELEELGGLA